MFKFIIDTDSYSGNFERQMCAYITGQIGGCGVGAELATIAQKELDKKILKKFEDEIESVADEHGCSRPCVIYDTPGYFNNGLGSIFKDGQEDKAVEHYNNWIKNNPQYSNDLKNIKKINKHLAFMSIAICFKDKPDITLIKIMKERAYKFSKMCLDENDFVKYIKGMNITGFRLFENKDLEIRI